MSHIETKNNKPRTGAFFMPSDYSAYNLIALEVVSL